MNVSDTVTVQDIPVQDTPTQVTPAHTEESVMTPWMVKGKVDYMAQIEHFGTSAIDGCLIARWERVTKMKAPYLIRRGLVFSHQDVDKILDCVEKGIPIYLYTGRGPSSDTMHLGHLIPFKLTRYLQQALNCIVVIQMSDDEKFLFKDGSCAIDLDKYRQYSYSNAKNIIACGFDPNKTLIFSNLESNAGSLYFNNVLLMKATNMSAIKATYGLGEILPPSVLTSLKETLDAEELKDEVSRDSAKIAEIRSTLRKFAGDSTTSVGQCVWPVFQCSPAFCTSFRSLFVNSILTTLREKKDLPQNISQNLKKVLKEMNTLKSQKSIMCLVPMAIDQAPYFRMARDNAHIIGCPKPAIIHSEFLPGLQQSHSKMSTTGNSKNTTLFLDMKPKDIASTIRSHAFSGGKERLIDHQTYGGDIRVDICYQYLTFFLEDDDQLKSIAEEYTSGRMSSAQIKKITSDVVSKVITDHQEALKTVSDAVVEQFFDWNRVLDIGGCYDRPELPEEEMTKYSNYNSYGINFDRTFGYSCKPMHVDT